MTWQATEAIGGVGGRSVVRLSDDTGETVELRGRAEALRTIAALVERGELAYDDAQKAFATGRVGYHVTFCGPKVGIQSCTVAFAAPGIRTSRDVEKLAAQIGGSLGGNDVCILGWTEIEIAPAVELASVIPPGLAESH